MEHKVDYCESCGWMLRCGTCGNNCCNSAYGELPDGSKCKDCKSAYEQQNNPTREQLIEVVNMLNYRNLKHKNIKAIDPVIKIKILANLQKKYDKLLPFVRYKGADKKEDVLAFEAIEASIFAIRELPERQSND